MNLEPLFAVLYTALHIIIGGSSHMAVRNAADGLAYLHEQWNTFRRPATFEKSSTATQHQTIDPPITR